MIWYKAWLESRWRFLICMGLIGSIVAADIFQAHLNMPRMGMQPGEFGKYVWKIYFTRFQLLWILSVLVLSMGGLVRERSAGTVDFSLSLPVSRRRWLAVRGAMAVSQATVLVLVPVLVVPLAARTIGLSYSPLDAAKFSLLVLLTGLFMLTIGILYSCLFAGEYTAVALGITTVFALTVLVNPLAGRYPFLSLSSGEYDLDGAWHLSNGFPLTAVVVKLVLAAILWETANRVVAKRSF
jgi:ABC-type transport system involved in multi-copper enzyme maturation permease subunit